jgi:hypothetical protein
MPIRGLDRNPSTKVWAVNIGGSYFTVRKSGTRLFIDDNPTVVTSVKPWGITAVNEIEVGKLTGNLSDAEKKTAVIGWVQRYVFDTITLLTTLPADDPARLADPDKGTFFWSDEGGTKNPAGLYITAREAVLVDFDEVSLLTDNLIATIRKA